MDCSLISGRLWWLEDFLRWAKWEDEVDLTVSDLESGKQGVLLLLFEGSWSRQRPVNGSIDRSNAENGKWVIWYECTALVMLSFLNWSYFLTVLLWLWPLAQIDSELRIPTFCPERSLFYPDFLFWILFPKIFPHQSSLLWWRNLFCDVDIWPWVAVISYQKWPLDGRFRNRPSF